MSEIESMIKLRDHQIIYRDKEINSLLTFLQAEISLSENFTFGDLWQAVEKERKTLGQVFHYSLGGHDLAMWEKDLSGEDFSLQEVQVYWGTELIESISLSIYPGFHGIEKLPSGEREPVALDFIPIGHLMSLPLKIDERFKIQTFRKSLTKPDVLLDTIRKFTVYDMLQAIFYGISYYGSPQKRNKIMDNIMDAMDEFKNS